MNKNPRWLDDTGDYTTQLYRDYITHYKDPYKPTSIMESRSLFFSWLICVQESFQFQPSAKAS